MLSLGKKTILINYKITNNIINASCKTFKYYLQIFFVIFVHSCKT